jgi:hypothetical protein
MTIKIKKEYTRKGDYFNTNSNLLIKSLEDKGFKDVYIIQGEWDGKKHYLFGLIKINKEGRITARANTIIMNLSKVNYPTDYILDLERE